MAPLTLREDLDQTFALLLPGHPSYGLLKRLIEDDDRRNNDDYLDIVPGRYDVEGDITALIEQQRAAVIDRIRKNGAVSVTTMEGDTGYHWAVYLADGDAETFLLYAAVKTTRDVMAALGVGPVAATELVIRAIEEGVGDEPPGV